jgi:hypothetical protein
VLTVTSTTAALCTGEVAVIDVGDSTVYEAAGYGPKYTPVAAVKFVPVIVTDVPPAVVPVPVPSAVTVGAEADVYVNWSDPLSAVTPAGVVTVTSTMPAGSDGLVAVMDVAEFTV